ncbi:MAG: pimeloyl-[acyl-carrier protein] methyl ester esterase [Paraglaciecola sp.]|jgi:pimeloyl-[acyl-carrier protein] methyl ester esterase
MDLVCKTAGQGEDLVLLHGWGVNSGVWRFVSERLERQFRVTYIDLPGFGINAQILPQRYDIDSIALDVSKCLPPSCILLGWSLGGLVAQKLAFNKTNSVRKLILLACSPKFIGDGDWPGIEHNVLTFFEQQLGQNFSQTLARFLAIQAMGSASAKADIKQIRSAIEQFPGPSMEALKGGLKILAESDFREQLGSLQIPTHWMFGKMDSLVPVNVSLQLANIQANASYNIFAKASHAPFISHPEEFVEELFKILN